MGKDKQPTIVSAQKEIYEDATSNGQLNYELHMQCTKRIVDRMCKNKIKNCNDENIVLMLNEIYNEICNDDFSNFECYLFEYLGALFAIKLDEKISNHELEDKREYLQLYEKSQKYKCTAIDKFKINCIDDTFFSYMMDKYYFYERDSYLLKKYPSKKAYEIIERILFGNKYHAFAIMDDYLFVVKRESKATFRMAKMLDEICNQKFSSRVRTYIVFLIEYIAIVVIALIYLRHKFL